MAGRQRRELFRAQVDPSLRSGGRRPHPGDATWTLTCCLAYGRAAAEACDLFAALGRSSQQLLAVAPRLRAKGAGAVIKNLLDEDAVLKHANKAFSPEVGSKAPHQFADRLMGTSKN